MLCSKVKMFVVGRITVGDAGVGAASVGHFARRRLLPARSGDFPESNGCRCRGFPALIRSLGPCLGPSARSAGQRVLRPIRADVDRGAQARDVQPGCEEIGSGENAREIYIMALGIASDNRALGNRPMRRACELMISGKWPSELNSQPECSRAE